MGCIHGKEVYGSGCVQRHASSDNRLQQRAANLSPHTLPDPSTLSPAAAALPAAHPHYAMTLPDSSAHGVLVARTPLPLNDTSQLLTHPADPWVGPVSSAADEGTSTDTSCSTPANAVKYDTNAAFCINGTSQPVLQPQTPDMVVVKRPPIAVQLLSSPPGDSGASSTESTASTEYVTQSSSGLFPVGYSELFNTPWLPIALIYHSLEPSDKRAFRLVSKGCKATADNAVAAMTVLQPSLGPRVSSLQLAESIAPLARRFQGLRTLRLDGLEVGESVAGRRIGIMVHAKEDVLQAACSGLQQVNASTLQSLHISDMGCVYHPVVAQAVAARLLHAAIACDASIPIPIPSASDACARTAAASAASGSASSVMPFGSHLAASSCTTIADSTTVASGGHLAVASRGHLAVAALTDLSIDFRLQLTGTQPPAASSTSSAFSLLCMGLAGMPVAPAEPEDDESQSADGSGPEAVGAAVPCTIGATAVNGVSSKSLDQAASPCKPPSSINCLCPLLSALASSLHCLSISDMRLLTTAEGASAGSGASHTARGTSVTGLVALHGSQTLHGMGSRTAASTVSNRVSVLSQLTAMTSLTFASYEQDCSTAFGMLQCLPSMHASSHIVAPLGASTPHTTGAPPAARNSSVSRTSSAAVQADAGGSMESLNAGFGAPPITDILASPWSLTPCRLQHLSMRFSTSAVQGQDKEEYCSIFSSRLACLRSLHLHMEVEQTGEALSQALLQELGQLTGLTSLSLCLHDADRHASLASHAVRLAGIQHSSREREQQRACTLGYALEQLSGLRELKLEATSFLGTDWSGPLDPLVLAGALSGRLPPGLRLLHLRPEFYNGWGIGWSAQVLQVLLQWPLYSPACLQDLRVHTLSIDAKFIQQMFMGPAIPMQAAAPGFALNLPPAHQLQSQAPMGMIPIQSVGNLRQTLLEGPHCLLRHAPQLQHFSLFHGVLHGRDNSDRRGLTPRQLQQHATEDQSILANAVHTASSPRVNNLALPLAALMSMQRLELAGLPEGSLIDLHAALPHMRNLAALIIRGRLDRGATPFRTYYACDAIGMRIVWHALMLPCMEVLILEGCDVANRTIDAAVSAIASSTERLLTRRKQQQAEQQQPLQYGASTNSMLSGMALCLPLKHLAFIGSLGITRGGLLVEALCTNPYIRRLQRLDLSRPQNGPLHTALGNAQQQRELAKLWLGMDPTRPAQHIVRSGAQLIMDLDPRAAEKAISEWPWRVVLPVCRATLHGSDVVWQDV